MKHLIYSILFFISLILLFGCSASRYTDLGSNFKDKRILEIGGKKVLLDLSDYQILIEKIIVEESGKRNESLEFNFHLPSLMFIYDLEGNLETIIYDFGSGIIGDESQDFVKFFLKDYESAVYKRDEYIRNDGKSRSYDQSAAGITYKEISIGVFREANKFCSKIKEALIKTWKEK